MLIVNPSSVVLGSEALDNVESVGVERHAEKLVVEWTDAGPHAAFADVPQQRVTARIVQALTGETLDGPRPGQALTLSLVTAAVGGEIGRRRLSASGVVTGCRVDAQRTARGGSAQRTIDLVLVSVDGATDPITIGPAGATGGEP